MLKKQYESVSNSEIAYIIDEWIRSERDRKLMKRRLIDGICHEPLAEEFGLSVNTVRKIIYKNEQIIFKHICDESKSNAIVCDMKEVLA